jgi:hypothetical protein
MEVLKEPVRITGNTAPISTRYLPNVHPPVQYFSVIFCHLGRNAQIARYEE